MKASLNDATHYNEITDEYWLLENELGIVTFQTERLLTENLGYRDHKYALLNEDHCYLL